MSGGRGGWCLWFWRRGRGGHREREMGARDLSGEVIVLAGPFGDEGS